jgi:hypothetical protein
MHVNYEGPCKVARWHGAAASDYECFVHPKSMQFLGSTSQDCEGPGCKGVTCTSNRQRSEVPCKPKFQTPAQSAVCTHNRSKRCRETIRCASGCSALCWARCLWPCPRYGPYRSRMPNIALVLPLGCSALSLLALNTSCLQRDLRYSPPLLLSPCHVLSCGHVFQHLERTELVSCSFLGPLRKERVKKVLDMSLMSSSCSAAAMRKWSSALALLSQEHLA